jgi:uncharacterized SAM-binding protein YcdF (DUF218 family)
MTDREKCISIIDNDCIQKSDAIILLEGDGLHRYQKAVELFKQGWADTLVFSGGITDYKYGSYPFCDVLPHLHASGIPTRAIIHEDRSHNTNEQAVEVIKLAYNNNWEKLILVASHEHQYRAYLTFLRQIIDSGKNLILFNAPARNLGWFIDSGWGSRFERVQIEFNKIELYSQHGHVATYSEAIEYQKWKEQQVYH